MAPKQKKPPTPETRRGSTAADPPPGWLAGMERHGFWVAALGLGLLLVIFFNPVFFAGKTFQPPDQVASMAHRPYLEESFGGDGSLVGRYPLWTPYIFSGMPSFGSLIAAPYTNPMSLLLTPIPGVFKVVTYYFLLGIFTWLFLRRRGLGVFTALTGAVAYIFCAHVVTLIMFGHNSKIATLVFLPLVLLATDEVWRRPTIRWTAILALAIGTMFVTSHLQVAYYTLLAAGLLLVEGTIFSLRTRQLSLAAVAGRWGAWAIAFLVGLAASSVLFMSVREYAAHSIRGGTGGGLPYDYATSWSFHPLELTTFFVPSFLGFGGASYWGWMPFTDFPHYMGILILFLAVLTLVLWPRERLHLYFLALAVFSLIVAFGRHIPVLYNLFFEYLPYFNKFRVPSMILLLFQFAVAMLAAIGLERLSRPADAEERARMRRGLWIVGGAFLAVVVGLGLMIATGTLESNAAPRLAERARSMGLQPPQISSFVSQQTAAVKGMAGRDAGLALVFLGAGLALVWARLRRQVPAWVLVLGVLAISIVDLWRVDAGPADYKTRTTDPRAFAPSSGVQYLLQDPGPYRILPLTGRGLHNNWFAYFRIPSILGYHPAKIKIYQDLIDDEGPVGIQKSLSQGNFNVVNMLNMKYLVMERETAGGPLEVVHRGSPHVVMRNNAALPRLWFVDRARVIADPEAHLTAVADPSWNPGEEALLFEDVGPFDAGAGGTARYTQHEPREIHAEIESPGDCLLVLSEVYYDAGWKARLDGEPVDIHRANYVLRAIRVPAGRHELVMRFDPPAFRRGLLLSVGSYGLIVLALAGSFLLDRRRRTGSGADAAEA